MEQFAVYIRDGCKQYGRGSKASSILQHLHMSVPRGSIYGLLGASGCGKTTLLSCIVGVQTLNSGDIWVLGGKPGAKGSDVPGPKIGYMPQDIALVGEFTVKEAIFYFGWLFDMKDRDIAERFDFLSRLLDLPPDDRYIKTLSGGQQRRVSFAAALVNNPELLILDEPTVGLDPVLRQNIWDYLVEITCGKQMTVIITTHYIEEARESHTIGLLRHGRLMAEDSPQRLLALYKCPALEDVFLALSVQQGDGDADLEHVQHQAETSNGIGLKKRETPEPTVTLAEATTPENSSPSRRTRPPGPCMECFKLTTFSRMKALLIKNFRSIYRNPGGLLFILMFPVLEISVFFIAIGGDPRSLRLAISNKELGNLTDCAEYRQYHDSGVFSVGLDDCRFHGISCMFLDHFNDSLAIKDYYGDEEAALAAVRTGFAVGSLHFPSNFSEELERREREGKDSLAGTLDDSEIGIHLDMSDRQIGLFLQQRLFDVYQEVAESIAVACNRSVKIAHIPLMFNDPVYGIKNPSYAMMVAPGVIISMIYFLATTLTSTVIITEQFEGVWDRNLVAGVTSAEILFSHILCQLTWMLIQSAEVLALSVLVFGVTCRGDVASVLLLVFLQGMCGMCYGLVISVVSENLTMANYMSLGSFLPFLNLSGVLWPIEGMPTALRWFSLTLPGTLPTLSMRYILEKGWSLAEPQVYHGYLMTAAWIVGQCAFCLIVLRIRSS